VILKGISSVALVGHIPCGAALSCGMLAIDELLRCLVAAKIDFVKRYAGALDVKVACFLHIHWSMIDPGNPDLKPRTYFVSRESALAFLANPPDLMAPGAYLENTPNLPVWD